MVSLERRLKFILQEISVKFFAKVSSWTIRQLIIHIGNHKWQVDGFLRKSTFAERLYKHVLWDKNAAPASALALSGRAGTCNQKQVIELFSKVDDKMVISDHHDRLLLAVLERASCTQSCSRASFMFTHFSRTREVCTWRFKPCRARQRRSRQSQIRDCSGHLPRRCTIAICITRDEHRSNIHLCSLCPYSVQLLTTLVFFFFFFITLGLELSDTKSTSLKYEPSLHQVGRVRLTST